LYGVIVKVLNNDSSAGDVLQDVFLKIWRHLDQYDEEKGRLFTWMLNIARNTAIDVLRSKSHKLEQRIQNITDNVHALNGPLAVHLSTDYIGFSRILEKLTKEQRTLIDLAYYKGCTQEEISRVLEIPLGTVKTRMRNAIIQLRNILNK
jgi:RNA polymerase sigma-70 factor (ECF subfamily)